MLRTDHMNDRLPYFIYSLLKQFDPDKKGYMTKTRFYKTAYIIHKNLQKRKTDVGLPWCWYIYGPEVQLRYVPEYVYRLEGSEDDSTKLFFGEQPKVVIKEKAAIDYEIQSLYKEFPKTEDLIKSVYEKAPKKMLLLFFEFEELMRDLEHEQGPMSVEKAKWVIQKIDEIRKNYSKEEFAELYPEFLDFDDMLRQVLDMKPDALKQLRPLMTKFRELVATKASILFNENLPEDWKAERKALFERRLSEFRPILMTESNKYQKQWNERDPSSRKLMSVAFEVAKGE